RKAGLHKLAVGHDASAQSTRVIAPRTGAFCRRRNRAMPVHRAGMLEAPVDRNPPRPPRLKSQLFGAHGVAPELEDVEILPGENVPVAIEKRTPQMFRQ